MKITFGITLTVLLIIASTPFCFIPSVEASFSCWAAPFLFGPVCKGVAVFGHKGYKRSYSVKVMGNAGTLVCCAAKGFNPKETWYSIGCNHSSIRASVPWGNVAAQEAIKCRGLPFGANVIVN